MDKIIGFSICCKDTPFNFPFKKQFDWIRFKKYRLSSWIVWLWGHGNFDAFIINGSETKIVIGYTKQEVDLFGTDNLHNRGGILRINEKYISVETDPIGALRVFYGHFANNACMSTTEELVLQAIENREIDRTNLIQYLLVGHMTGRQTIYKHVHAMEANQKVSWDGRIFKRTRLRPLSFNRSQDPIQSLYEATTTVIQQYTGCHEKLFLPLSGGYDSRMLAANQQTNCNIMARTYGYSYPIENAYEVSRAKAVARELRIDDWKPVDLGSDFIAKYGPKWFDIFGTSHHLHGMYILCFYDKVFSEEELRPTISGFLGDAVVGHQLRDFKRLTNPDPAVMLHSAQYKGPLGFTTHELRKLLPWDIDEHLEIILKRWTSLWLSTEGEPYQKFILSLLRERGRSHVSYLCTIADIYGGVITPFIDRCYIETVLGLPESSLIDRSAQETVFKKFYPQVFLNEESFPRYEHYLNHLAMKQCKNGNIFPIINNGEIQRHPLILNEGLHSIVDNYIKVCEHPTLIQGQHKIRSLYQCKMLLPLFFDHHYRNVHESIDPSDSIVLDSLSQQNIYPRNDLIKIGTEYGGWIVPSNLFDRDSICYCVGCGEDITFDIGLSDRFGCDIYAFDPTPRAIEYVKSVTQDNAKYYFFDIGIWDKEETLKFFVPKNPDHVSHSIVNLQKTNEYIYAKVKRLSSIMAELEHDKIDLLKIDIEGAEYRVIESIIEDDIDIKVICVEFDELHNPIDSNYKTRIQSCIVKLVSKGYVIVCAQGNGNYTFVKMDDVDSKHVSQAFPIRYQTMGACHEKRGVNTPPALQSNSENLRDCVNAANFQDIVQCNHTVLYFGRDGGFSLDQLKAQKVIWISSDAATRVEALKKGEFAVDSIDFVPDNIADIIVSHHTLERTQNPLQALVKLRHKLKTGGRSLFFVLSQNPNEDYRDNDAKGQLYNWNPLTLGNLFKAAGYLIVSVDSIQHRCSSVFHQTPTTNGKAAFFEGGECSVNVDSHYQIRIVAQRSQG